MDFSKILDYYYQRLTNNESNITNMYLISNKICINNKTNIVDNISECPYCTYSYLMTLFEETRVYGNIEENSKVFAIKDNCITNKLFSNKVFEEKLQIIKLSLLLV